MKKKYFQKTNGLKNLKNTGHQVKNMHLVYLKILLIKKLKIIQKQEIILI